MRFKGARVQGVKGVGHGEPRGGMVVNKRGLGWVAYLCSTAQLWCWESVAPPWAGEKKQYTVKEDTTPLIEFTLLGIR